MPNSPTDLLAPPATEVPDPGWTTSEFWVTIATNLISLVVAMATVFGKTLDSSALTALVPAVSVLAAALTTALYARSRASVKSVTTQENTQRLNTYTNARTLDALRLGLATAQSSGPSPELVWALVPANAVVSPGQTPLNGTAQRPAAVFRGVQS